MGRARRGRHGIYNMGTRRAASERRRRRQRHGGIDNRSATVHNDGATATESTSGPPARVVMGCSRQTREEVPSTPTFDY